MKVLLIFRFCHYIWFIDSKILLMYHSYFERKDDKVLTFDIVHFPNFEINASLLLPPFSNKRRTSQFQNLISAAGAY